MQSQHRYSEVNTLLARAEQEMESEMDTTLHGEFNALRAQVAINDGDPDEAERLAMVALDELPLANLQPYWVPPRYTAKCCTVRAISRVRFHSCSKPNRWRAATMSGITPCGA